MIYYLDKTSSADATTSVFSFDDSMIAPARNASEASEAELLKGVGNTCFKKKEYEKVSPSKKRQTPSHYNRLPSSFDRLSKIILQPLQSMVTLLLYGVIGQLAILSWGGTSMRYSMPKSVVD